MAKSSSPRKHTKQDLRPQIRIMFRKAIAMGPGKADLLRAIDETGSISAAARQMEMSYRRAWLLIDDMNQCFRHAVVSAKPGGSQGGGAVLTEFGAELVRDYRAIEMAAEVAAKKRLRGLEAALRKSRAANSAKPKKTSIRRRKP